MKQRIDNQLTGVGLNDYVGGDQINQRNYISVYQEAERDFVVTHNADIKPVSYFTGRETELTELRQSIEEGRKAVLVSGMGGIGKTHICRKLFEEYSINMQRMEEGHFVILDILSMMEIWAAVCRNV